VLFLGFCFGGDGDYGISWVSPHNDVVWFFLPIV